VRATTRVRERDLQVVRFFQDNLKGSLKEQVKAINIDDERHVALKVAFGKQPIWVLLGRPEKLQYKLFLLRELLEQLKAEKDQIRSVDLRYSAPVVRKR
jgi:hypothetical protein